MNELKVGKRIAELRNIKNITQLDLAEKLGVTDRAVSKWETGGSYPDISLLPQIADIFGVSVDYLLRGKSFVKQELYVDYVTGRYSETVNKKFIADGYKIVNMQLSGDGDGACMCAVLMEKEMFED